MEGFFEKIREELTQSVRQHFIVHHLHEQAKLFLDEKLKESLLFGKMTVLHYRMFGGEGDRIYQAAAAVEMMILGLDIIDDLQDQDNIGMAWSKVSPAIALNIAIGFLTMSQHTLLSSPFPQEHKLLAAQRMNAQILTAINGQTIDLLNDVNTEEDYIQMISQKSAALLVAACMTGTVLASGQEVEQVAEYALELGIAAQMKNDIRDLLNWEHKNDFLNRKRTLPTLFLLQSLTEEDFWVADYFEGRLQYEDVQDRKHELEQLVERSGASLYSSVKMRVHYYQYLERIDAMSLDPIWKEQMLAFAQ